MTGYRILETTSDPVCRTQRVLPYPPGAIFDAFARPELLEQWWGPKE
jgi:uncharacterized protein YndB with AHSA1/START domain